MATVAFQKNRGFFGIRGKPSDNAAAIIHKQKKHVCVRSGGRPDILYRIFFALNAIELLQKNNFFSYFGLD